MATTKINDVKYKALNGTYFSFVLNLFAYWNFGILQQARTEHGRNMVEQVRNLAHLHGQITLKDLFQSIRSNLVAGHTVPLLGSPAMIVIDTVEIIVFIVVGKCGKERSVVHPRNIDPIDAHLHVTQNRSRSVRKVVQIPVALFKV